MGRDVLVGKINRVMERADEKTLMRVYKILVKLVEIQRGSGK